MIDSQEFIHLGTFGDGLQVVRVSEIESAGYGPFNREIRMKSGKCFSCEQTELNRVADLLGHPFPASAPLPQAAMTQAEFLRANTNGDSGRSPKDVSLGQTLILPGGMEIKFTERLPDGCVIQISVPSEERPADTAR